MIWNCITHNLIFPLSYACGPNIISTPYTSIFKRGHQKNHFVLRASFLRLHLTSVNIYPVTSVCNSLNLSRSEPRIYISFARFTYLKFNHSMEKISWEANQIMDGQEFLAFFWKLKVLCRFYKSSPSISILKICARLQTEMEIFGGFYCDEKETWCCHSWYKITDIYKHFWVSRCCNVQLAWSAGISEFVEISDENTICHNTETVIHWTNHLHF